MDDLTAEPTPPRRATRRQRRFVLPQDHHDARTSERIEAFLEGPSRPTRRRLEARRRAPRPIVLATDAEWRSALRSEVVRFERYGRPATVLVVDVASDVTSVPLTELVDPVLDAIRHEARETDRAVRVSSTRFNLLLPETGERDAHLFANRLREAWRNRLNGHGGLLRLRIEAQTQSPGRSLEDALVDAERRLEG